METSNQLRIECLSADSASLAEDIRMLGAVLHACVHAGASVSFVLPFSQEQAAAWWRDRILPAVRSGDCRVLTARLHGSIAGTVQLDLDTPPNQPHRAEVRKLLVHPEARRLGIARALMSAAEDVALQAGRTLLTLDTLTGSTAEALYVSMGYIRAGVIPGYSLRPDTPELDAATFLYKPLTPGPASR